MENWIPLVSACVGGLLATIPLLLGLMVQVYIHLSENRQKRREAKTLLTLELVTKDVAIVEKHINDELITMQYMIDLIVKRVQRNLSSEEVREEIQSSLSFQDGKLYKLTEADTIADKIAYSFGNEFNTEYKYFHERCLEFVQIVVNFPSDWRERATKTNGEAIKSSTNLHVMLREKLVSLRE